MGRLENSAMLWRQVVAQEYQHVDIFTERKKKEAEKKESSQTITAEEMDEDERNARLEELERKRKEREAEGIRKEAERVKKAEERERKRRLENPWEEFPIMMKNPITKEKEETTLVKEKQKLQE